MDNQNIKTFPYETSSCNPVTLRQHKLSIPADVASSEKPAGPTNRHRVLCGGLAFVRWNAPKNHNRLVNASNSHIRHAPKTTKRLNFSQYIIVDHCEANQSRKDHGIEE